MNLAISPLLTLLATDATINPHCKYREQIENNKIADSLADKFGVSLSPDVFSTMKNGCYANWTEKENQRRSARFNKVLARGRRKITSIVRGAYLKGALGGKKIKSKTVLRRKLRIGGEYTEDEEIQTSETESEMPVDVGG